MTSHGATGLLRELREHFCTEPHHYECDDPWYSCPMSRDGCADDRQTGCTCGALQTAERNKEIVFRIDAILSLADAKAGKVVPLEPTKEMLIEMRDQLPMAGVFFESDDFLTALYKAALAAAPSDSGA